MNTIALILIFDASILASIASQPDLPDDFNGSSAVAEKETTRISGRFMKVVSSESPGLIRSKVSVSEKWIVSESWCANCPAAKNRFLSAGGKGENIINIARAKSDFGMNVSAVPFEFSANREIEILQPPSYRSQWPPVWDVNGDKRPSRDILLNHLRRDTNHKNKHWQAWYLESWKKEQLAALHDDDHTGKAPSYSELPEDDVTADVDAIPSMDVAMSLMVEHLATENAKTGGPASGLFNITVDVDKDARKRVVDLLTKKRIDFSSGSIEWGGDRTISIGNGRIGINPGATVTGKKFGIFITTKLTGVSYASDLSWVTMELDGAPDLTVNFTNKEQTP